MDETTAGATPKAITIELDYDVATYYKHKATLNEADIRAMNERMLDINNPYEIFDYLLEVGRIDPAKDALTLRGGAGMNNWFEFTHVMPNGDAVPIEV